MFIPDETAVQTLATISDVQLVNGRFKRVQFSDDSAWLLCLRTYVGVVTLSVMSGSLRQVVHNHNHQTITARTWWSSLKTFQLVS